MSLTDSLRRLDLALKLNIFPRDRLLAAFSADGLDFDRRPGLAVDVGPGMENVLYPCLVQALEGQRLYFYAARRDERGWTGSVRLAVSADGATWRLKRTPCLEPDCPEDDRGCRAPCVFGGGEEWTMLYFGHGSDGQVRLRWAFSRDGVSWTKRGPVKLAGEGWPDEVLDAAPLKEKDHWRIFLTGRSGFRQAVYSARWDGAGGLELEPGERLSAGGRGFRALVHRPWPLYLADGRVRLYFQGMDHNSILGCCIYSALSLDGLNFVPEPGVRLAPAGRGGDKHAVEYPTVLASDKGVSLVYTGCFGSHLLEPLTISWHQSGEPWLATLRRLQPGLAAGRETGVGGLFPLARRVRRLALGRVLAVGGDWETLLGEAVGAEHKCALTTKPPGSNTAESEANIKVLSTSDSAWPFRSGSFDTVILAAARREDTNRRRIEIGLEEAARVLKPGGRLLAALRLRAASLHPLRLERLAADQGLVVEESLAWPTLPFSLARRASLALPFLERLGRRRLMKGLAGGAVITARKTD